MLLGCSPHAFTQETHPNLFFRSRGLKAQVYHKSLCGPATTMGLQHLLCVYTWCRAQLVASVSGCLSAAAIPTQGGRSCEEAIPTANVPTFLLQADSADSTCGEVFFLTCIAPCVKTQSSTSLSSSWSKGIW